MSTSYIDTILNLLYAGEKVRISFPSPSLRETFRKKLYAKKREQDEALLALLDEPKQQLSCDWPDTPTQGTHTLTCWLSPKVSKEFNFEIIKEVEQLEQIDNILREDETLSRDLATTPSQSNKT